MKYQSTKTFGNDRGLSCAFRQPKATHSHCSLIHGYSLGFKFVFEADTLDDKNWVYDFGNTKWIKAYLEENFDHTIAVDKQDPAVADFARLETVGIAKIVLMDEPTAALAVKEVGKVLDLILNLKKLGVSVIVISHRMDDIFTVCDRVMALFQGTNFAESELKNTSRDEVIGWIMGKKD